MQTRLLSEITQTASGADAERILRTCVHCGFCNATCPSYQILGDELDSPRGRIYLIKQLLEGNDCGALTRMHLDRCLQCGSCETTCPSGVRYSRLLDYGQKHLEKISPRGKIEQLQLRLLTSVLSDRRGFAALLALARIARPFLPVALKQRIPIRSQLIDWPTAKHMRRLLRLQGCVHEVLAPNIERAAAKVFDRVSISLSTATGCCGALQYHLGAHEPAKQRIRANLDRWLPGLATPPNLVLSPSRKAGDQAEAFISTASGCTSFLRSYGEIMADDPEYSERARQFSAVVKDPGEILSGMDLTPFTPKTKKHIAFQAPCTLTHSLRLSDNTAGILTRLGHSLLTVAEPHLCCGSAGTYSLLQPEISRQLRDRKLIALERENPELIVSANIGCISHLQTQTRVPVRHWLELLADEVA